MKIVHVMNWYIPNMGYQENFLPLEQKNLGHKVEVITSDRIPIYKGYNQHIGRIYKDRIVGVGVFEDNGIIIYRLPCFYEMKNNGQIILKGLVKKIKELKPDIVQVHGAFTLLTLQIILYSFFFKFKLYVDDHTNPDNFKIDSFIKKWYVLFVKIYYQILGSKVKCFMPVTYASRDILKSKLGIYNIKLILTPLGADTNTFRSNSEQRKTMRKLLKLNRNNILIISSGKFDERKEIETLIKAFANLSFCNKNIKLLLLGNGSTEYMDKIKYLIESLGIKNKVIFHDFVLNKELPEFYNSADIGVWPGDASITVIEAVATGLPVIVPLSDKNYQILFKNKAALGFQKQSTSDLTKKINILIKDKSFHKQLKQNSLILANKDISWKNIAMKYIDLYKRYN